MTETMAVRTRRNVQRSALHCNRNASGYAALPIPLSKSEIKEKGYSVVPAGLTNRSLYPSTEVLGYFRLPAVTHLFADIKQMVNFYAIGNAPTHLRRGFGVAGRAGRLQGTDAPTRLRRGFGEARRAQRLQGSMTETHDPNGRLVDKSADRREPPG
jgi:hypothetical protein